MENDRKKIIKIMQNERCTWVSTACALQIKNLSNLPSKKLDPRAIET